MEKVLVNYGASMKVILEGYGSCMMPPKYGGRIMAVCGKHGISMGEAAQQYRGCIWNVQ